jgi:predicted transposase YbfD/YdcC
MCLGQIKVDEKSNEITALPALLDLLMLKGCIVIMDAMGRHREVAQKIVAQGGDYILAVKDNQPSLHQHVSFYLDSALELARTEGKYYDDVSKGHGRHEARRCWVIDDLEPWLEGAGQWRR